MNIETIFNELGINAITATNLIQWLDIDIDELSLPTKFSKLQHVVGFLKQFPEDTQRFLITKATRGKLVDKLDHMFEYSNLLENKTRLDSQLKNVEEEIPMIQNIGDIMRLGELELSKRELQSSINKLQEEISIYEK